MRKKKLVTIEHYASPVSRLWYSNESCGEKLIASVWDDNEHLLYFGPRRTKLSTNISPPPKLRFKQRKHHG